MRPPTSAIGSIDAHASSEFGKNAISSITTRYTDSPRAGSLPDGNDSTADSLLKDIFSWLLSIMDGPLRIIHLGRNLKPYLDFCNSFIASRSVRDNMMMKRSFQKNVSQNTNAAAKVENPIWRALRTIVLRSPIHDRTVSNCASRISNLMRPFSGCLMYQ